MGADGGSEVGWQLDGAWPAVKHRRTLTCVKVGAEGKTGIEKGRRHDNHTQGEEHPPRCAAEDGSLSTSKGQE